jgi:hypothetical protein
MLNSCLRSVSDSMRRRGSLAVCPLDAYYFPDSSAFYTGEEWQDSGIWAAIAPARYVDPATGRVKEWAEDWQNTVAALVGEHPPMAPQVAATVLKQSGVSAISYCKTAHSRADVQSSTGAGASARLAHGRTIR